MAAQKTALAINTIDVNGLELDKLKKGKIQHYASILYNNHLNNSRHSLMFKIDWFTMTTKGIPYLDSENPHPESVKGHYANDGKRCFARISLDDTQPNLAEARDLFIDIDEWAQSDEMQDKIKEMLGADNIKYSRGVQNFGSDEKPANDMVKIKFDTLYDANGQSDNPTLTTRFYKDGETTQYKPASITELEKSFTWNSSVRAIVCPTIMWFRTKTESTPSKVKGGKPTKTTSAEYGINYVFKRIDFTTGGKDESANVGFGDDDVVECPPRAKKEVVKPKKVEEEVDFDDEPKKTKKSKYDSDEEEVPPKKKASKYDSDEEEAPPKKKASKYDSDEEEAPPKKKASKYDSDEEDESPKKKASKPKKKAAPPPESDEEEYEESEEEVVPQKKKSRN